MIKTVVIATSNPDKVEEINDIAADSGIEFICAPEKFNAVENGETFAENAYIKAREAALMTGMYALGDDSGLCVDAMGGAPGIYSSRFASTPKKRIIKLLDLLRNVPEEDRTAKFVCSMVLVDPEGQKVKGADGAVYGNIIYNRNTQLTILKMIFEKWNKEFEKLSRARSSQKNNDKKLDVLFELIDILSVISLFFKNPHFKDEKEYRIIFINNFRNDAFKQTKIFEKNGLFVPYIEYKFRKRTVDSINIGPTLEENIFYTSTCRMLSNFGYEKKKINRSKIPLRY